MFDRIKKLISISAAVLVLFIFQILELVFSKGPFTCNFAASRATVSCSITVVGISLSSAEQLF